MKLRYHGEAADDAVGENRGTSSPGDQCQIWRAKK